MAKAGLLVKAVNKPTCQGMVPLRYRYTLVRDLLPPDYLPHPPPPPLHLSVTQTEAEVEEQTKRLPGIEFCLVYSSSPVCVFVYL